MSSLNCLERFKEVLLLDDDNSEKDLLIKGLLRLYLQASKPLFGFSTAIGHISELLGEALDEVKPEYTIEKAMRKLGNKLDNVAHEFDLQLLTESCAEEMKALIYSLVPFDTDKADQLGIEAVTTFANFDLCEHQAEKMKLNIKDVELAQSCAWDYIEDKEDELDDEE